MTIMVRERQRWKAQQWHRMGDHPRVTLRNGMDGTNKGYPALWTERAGWTMVWPGDWIIEDERGVFYSVRPATFALLYEVIP